MVTDPATCTCLAADGKAPKCVVFPASGKEVAAVLKRAAEHDLAVIPCRNATKLGIGNPPRRHDVALSLKEMNRVWHFEPADLTVSVEPGMKFGDFQRFLARHGLWLPLDPPGAGRASLGGILAANSAGPMRLHYGAPRDMVLGMKIATTEGKIVKTGGRVVKNVAGYDLAKLIVGSYGTLGVIVEASLKLYPLPAGRATFVFLAATLEVARDLRRRLLDSPLDLMRMVLLDVAASVFSRAGTRLTAEAAQLGPFELWVEAGGSPRVRERCAHELGEVARAVGTKVELLEGDGPEEVWERISDFRTWFSASFPDAVIMKSSLLPAQCEEFMGRARQEAASRQVRLIFFCQPGVGIVHLCLRGERGAPDVLPFARKLRSLAEELGGALVVEQCPAALKSEMDVWGAPGDDFGVMRKMKEAWDPAGILAPGRFVGGL